MYNVKSVYGVGRKSNTENAQAGDANVSLPDVASSGLPRSSLGNVASLLYVYGRVIISKHRPDRNAYCHRQK